MMARLSSQEVQLEVIDGKQGLPATDGRHSAFMSIRCMGTLTLLCYGLRQGEQAPYELVLVPGHFGSVTPGSGSRCHAWREPSDHDIAAWGEVIPAEDWIRNLPCQSTAYGELEVALHMLNSGQGSLSS